MLIRYTCTYKDLEIFILKSDNGSIKYEKKNPKKHHAIAILIWK